jgi:hypothetical protein
MKHGIRVTLIFIVKETLLFLTQRPWQKEKPELTEDNSLQPRIL